MSPMQPIIRLLGILFLTLYLIAGKSWSNIILINTLKEFRSYSLCEHSARTLSEMNRALRELLVFHPHYLTRLEQLPFSQIISLLEEGGYLKSVGPSSEQSYNYAEQNYKYKEGRFVSSSTCSSYTSSTIEYGNDEVLYNALVQNELTPVRSKALQVLFGTPISLLNPELLLSNFSRETDHKIQELYFKIFTREDFFKLLANDAHVSELRRLLGARPETKLRSQKAQQLYLDYLIRAQYQKPEVRTVMYSLDHGYPNEYLQSLFDRNPELIQSFIPAFTLGYGGHVPFLYEILKKNWKTSANARKALLFALKNRRKPHFYRIESSLITFFERTSGIQYRGDDSVYHQWFHQLKN